MQRDSIFLKKDHSFLENFISRRQISYAFKTHFKSDKIPNIQDKRFPIAYHATNPEGKNNGVTTLISKHTSFQLIDSMHDPLGRYLFLKGKIGSHPITIRNIYAPNTKQSCILSP